MAPLLACWLHGRVGRRQSYPACSHSLVPLYHSMEHGSYYGLRGFLAYADVEADPALGNITDLLPLFCLWHRILDNQN